MRAIKEHNVRLRLHGTPQENSAVLEALAAVLEIRDVSRPYHDRPPSTLERIYLEVQVRPTTAPAIPLQRTGDR
jgi:hypothetical protein